MAREIFNTLHQDMELSHEWIESLVKKTNKENVFETISKALELPTIDSVSVTDTDIDESIEQDLILLKEDYENGEITKDQYEIEIDKASNREVVKMELIQAEHEAELLDAIAACETVVALLGKKTSSFNSFLDLKKTGFLKKFEVIKDTIDRNKLLNCIDKCLEVTSLIKSKDYINALGIYDSVHVDDWIQSVAELEHGLVHGELLIQAKKGSESNPRQ